MKTQTRTTTKKVARPIKTAKPAAKKGKHFSATDIAMDKAAAIAAKELKGCKTPEDIARWYSKHFLTAGYKRLTKVMWAHYKIEHDWKAIRKPI